MKILKLPKSPWWDKKKITCLSCGAQLQLEKDDKVKVSSDRDGTCIIVECPCCKNNVFVAAP